MNRVNGSTSKRLPPKEIRVQTEAIEAGFTLMSILERVTDRRIAAVNTGIALNRLKQMICQKMPPEETRERIKAAETALDAVLGAIDAQKKDVDIVNAEIAAEHAFRRLTRMLWDF